jgi:long-subunit acyl-CoA synthetase (AMP-forming)
VLVYLYHFLGFSIYYAETWAPSRKHQEVHPTMMTCVPRVLEKMYDKLYLAGKKQKGIKKRLYYWAFELASTTSWTTTQPGTNQSSIKWLTNSSTANGAKPSVAISTSWYPAERPSRNTRRFLQRHWHACV